MLVSIHAPVWGATVAMESRIRELRVSIHAPVWGATACAYGGKHGCIVSIHAPVWGATARRRRAISFAGFQSTRPYGARQECEQWSFASSSFNPRARMGRDPVSLPPRLCRASFNPRARMGRDAAMVCWM